MNDRHDTCRDLHVRRDRASLLEGTCSREPIAQNCSCLCAMLLYTLL